MAAKGSRLSRAIQFFEEAEHREMRAAWIIVKEVVEKRLAEQGPGKVAAKPKVTRGRKPKLSAMLAPAERLSDAAADAAAPF
jgi:hypothetical protein